jgi:hypothetical protein
MVPKIRTTVVGEEQRMGRGGRHSVDEVEQAPRAAGRAA